MHMSFPRVKRISSAGFFISGWEGGLRNGLDWAHSDRMEPNEAIQTIRGLANQIATSVTAIHPLVPALADSPTQGEVLKALYELTKSVEVIKKQLLKLEKRDDSARL